MKSPAMLCMSETTCRRDCFPTSHQRIVLPRHLVKPTRASSILSSYMFVSVFLLNVKQSDAIYMNYCWCRKGNLWIQEIWFMCWLQSIWILCETNYRTWLHWLRSLILTNSVSKQPLCNCWVENFSKATPVLSSSWVRSSIHQASERKFYIIQTIDTSITAMCNCHAGPIFVGL
jgi:hypothetical protein